jgi:hypothetical protein
MRGRAEVIAMPITLKLENGNEVDIYPKASTGLFTVDLNGKDKATRVSADSLIIMLYKLRQITCVINSWKAIL